MSAPRPNFTAPTIFLYAYVVLTQVASGMYEAAQVEPVPAFILISQLGFFWALACWLQRDMDSQAIRWAVDVGFFLYLGWLFVLPYYLFKTRGPRAALVILAFVAVYLGSLAAGIAAYVFAVL